MVSESHEHDWTHQWIASSGTLMCMRIIVVGGGIIGLSCAFRLAQRDHDVTVVSADDVSDTTSTVAGGLIYPRHTGSDGRETAWTAATVAQFYDKGDGRGFDPNADPSKSRESFYVDYEHGIVVVRQNASHTANGDDAEVGDPSVGVEQDPSGRVRIHNEASNPLAPDIAKDGHFSVRNDLVIDPHNGTSPASVNGEVTRFPSWEMYQSHDDGTSTTMLQRHEEDHIAGSGPMLGLPQPTVPVGKNPGELDDWRKDYHPDQGHESQWDKLLQFPATRGDNFFQYPVKPEPYPSVNGHGNLTVPNAGQVH